MNTARQTLGQAFAAGSAHYRELRPGYPTDAVRWLVDDLQPGAAVADIGAGTGKLTSELVRLGLEVTAVDPSADMLAQVAAHLPKARIMIGSGERTGLADSSLDGATFAQSWHWVEPDAGQRELVRILRPGGTVALVWNLMDTAVDWVADYAAIMHSVHGWEAVSADYEPPVLSAGFLELEHAEFDWQHRLGRDALAALVTTRSYFLAASRTEQEQVQNRMSSFVRSTFGDVAQVALPYRAWCYRARRS